MENPSLIEFCKDLGQLATESLSYDLSEFGRSETKPFRRRYAARPVRISVLSGDSSKVGQQKIFYPTRQLELV